MIIVSVIIIFLVYLIINHIFYLHKTVEGVTAGSNESKKITDIKTETENNDISLNSLQNMSDTINTRCKGVRDLYADEQVEGSLKNTNKKIEKCIKTCHTPVIPGTYHKPLETNLTGKG